MTELEKLIKAMAPPLIFEGKQAGAGLTIEQELTRLREFYAVTYESESEIFKPGEIIWHRMPALSQYRSAARPNIFLGYLDKPIRGWEMPLKPNMLSSANVAAEVDCIVGVLEQHGDDGTFVRFLKTSREYTRAQPKV